jgi:hypothetical protein
LAAASYTAPATKRSRPTARTTIAEIDFDNLDGLQAYLRHPAHEELGKRFGQSLEAAMVYDFEMGGVEELRAGRFFEA